MLPSNSTAPVSVTGTLHHLGVHHGGAHHGGWHHLSSLDVLLLLAIGANCVLILSPMGSALKAAHAQLNPKEFAGFLAPTYLLFGQSYFWACYGTYAGQVDIAHFNTFGAGMCFLYLAMVTLNTHQSRQTQAFIVMAVALTVMFSTSVANSPMRDTERLQAYACAATAFSTLQSLSPMVQAIDVWRRKMPASAFPHAMASASCISSILWAVYAHMVHDTVYMVSNALNSLASVVEVAIVAWVMLRAKDGEEPQFEEDHPLMPRTKRKARAGAYGTPPGSQMGIVHMTWAARGAGCSIDAGSSNKKFGGVGFSLSRLWKIKEKDEEVPISVSETKRLIKSPFSGPADPHISEEEPELEPDFKAEWGVVDSVKEWANIAHSRLHGVDHVL